MMLYGLRPIQLTPLRTKKPLHILIPIRLLYINNGEIMLNDDTRLKIKETLADIRADHMAEDNYHVAWFGITGLDSATDEELIEEMFLYHGDDENELLTKAEAEMATHAILNPARTFPNNKLNICFDVDGTLIHQVGDREDTPRYEIVQLFQLYESFGCNMFIWSGGGVDYAERWRDKLGLKAKVVGKGEFIADIAFDDMEVTLGKVNIQV